MSYVFYRIVHLVGIFLLFVAFGGLLHKGFSGGERKVGRRFLMVSHGVSLLLVLLGGFGMLAKMGAGFPSWVHPKLGIWVLMGAAVAAIGRNPTLDRVLWFLLPALGVVSAWVAIAKP